MCVQTISVVRLTCKALPHRQIDALLSEHVTSLFSVLLLSLTPPRGYSFCVLFFRIIKISLGEQIYSVPYHYRPVLLDKP